MMLHIDRTDAHMNTIMTKLDAPFLVYKIILLL